jgi:hypothetical protein
MLAVLLISGVIASCGQAAPSGVASAAQSEEALPTILVAKTGDGGGDQALFTGQLEVEAGCLVFKAGSDTWVPIWPNGYNVVSSPTGEFTVVDENGQDVTSTSGVVRVGGGEANPIGAGGHNATDEWARNVTGTEIPETCSGGKYWLVNPGP